MAIAARDEDRNKYYVPVTRVYSHSRVSAAEAMPAPIPERPREPHRPIIPQQPETEPKRRPAPKPKPHTGRKFLYLCSLAIVTAAALFMLTRYAAISGSYNELNSLKGSIDESKQKLRALEVQLQYSIDLDAVREAAELAGMDYPTVDQIIGVGPDNNGEGAKSPQG